MGHSVIKLKFDGGGEYVSSIFLSHLDEKGITYQWTPRNTPAQNARVEHFWDTLQSRMRALLIHAELPEAIIGV